MDTQKIEVGFLRENCYVVSKNDEALIIDPGDDKEKIISLVGNKKVLAILITHYHFDHIGALAFVKKYYNAKIVDYKSDKLQMIGPFFFEVVETKGHTEDSVSYYFKDEGIMFVGDFIFEGTIGRCDLEGGDFEKMKKSLKKIKSYDKNIIFYPGHGKETTLENELLHNEYMKGDYYE